MVTFTYSDVGSLLLPIPVKFDHSGILISDFLSLQVTRPKLFVPCLFRSESWEQGEARTAPVLQVLPRAASLLDDDGAWGALLEKRVTEGRCVPWSWSLTTAGARFGL